MRPLRLRSLLKDSLRIGAILLVLYATGAVANAMSELPFLVNAGDLVRTGFVFAGTSVAVLYVVVRSVALGSASGGDRSKMVDSSSFGREAVVVATPVVFWFALAGLATTLAGHSTLNAAVETLVLASTRAGILTVLLYVLARGIGVLQSPEVN
ncbi:hypothetical protein [Halorussus halophilus]|uniref:hypothetical protein n=1 Tax=Halorussus halophilus TaxID=2650975 RepID=UPI001300E965|nr:hypothetical protein [Halorussus halophilus]